MVVLVDSRQTMRLMLQNKQLLAAVIVVAIFWMVGGVVLQTVNALGITQLGLNELQTSVLNVAIGLGTAIGCMLGGYLSRGRINRSVVVGGAVGTVVTLVLMSLPGKPPDICSASTAAFPCSCCWVHSAECLLFRCR